MPRLFALASALVLISALVLAQMPEQGGAADASQFPEPNARKVVIYKNEACGHCDMYLKDFRHFLRLHGYANVEEKLMINDSSNREELARLTAEKGIPLEMQGHMIVVIEDRLVLEGHVPIPLLEGLFEEYTSKPFPKIVVLQDSMEPLSELKTYKVMGEDGKIAEKKITEPIITEAQVKAGEKEKEGKSGIEGLIPLVVITGLVDGINPCAFGVLLFFITFLYTMRKSKLEIWKTGAIFIAMIFLTYLLIGMGLLQAILISGEPHLFGKISAGLMAILALVNLKDYFFYGKWFSLRMPAFAGPLIKERMKEMTTLSVIVLGFLVGLCTFPCSGGIYVGILSLLAIQTTFSEGFALLLLYNIMFVMPLIAIMLFATSRRVTERIEAYEREHKNVMKLGTGIVMLGLAVILWVLSA